MEDQIADYFAFIRARNERLRESGIFRRVFDQTALDAASHHALDGEGFAVEPERGDVANRNRFRPRDQ